MTLPTKKKNRGSCPPPKLLAHGTDEVVNHSQNHRNQCKDDKEGVDVDRVSLIQSHLLEVPLCLLQMRIELQSLPVVERGLFVLLHGLVDLAQREVLEPRLALGDGYLHVEGALGQEDGVVVELQVEEDSGQVEEDVGMVRGEVEGLAEALDGLLRVPLDSPEVAHFV